jgi:hypothetical protein
MTKNPPAKKVESKRPASKGRPARLADRFAQKGRAVPNAEPATLNATEAQLPPPTTALSETVPAPDLGSKAEPQPKKDDIPRGLENTTALTVRLDPERYRRVRYHTFDYDLTNQELLVYALDAYLAAHDVLKAHGRPAERLSKETLVDALGAYLKAKK